MASSVITTIHSTLEDLKLLRNEYSGGANILYLMLLLRLLRTFLLCARKLDENNKDGNLGSRLPKILRTFLLRARKLDENNKDGNLGSLVANIKDRVLRNAEKIHVYRLRTEDVFERDVLKEVTDHFNHEIIYFFEEIRNSNISLPDYMLQSSCPTRDEVVEIIDSLLNTIVECDHYVVAHGYGVEKLIDALEEKLIFLKSFISFATRQGIKRPLLEDLLIRIEAVVVNEAHHYILRLNNCGVINYWTIRQKVPQWAQQMKLIEPEVYETYIQALSNSKSSAHSRAHALDMDEDDDAICVIMKDFIHSLAYNLWEMLQLDNCLVVSIKDQLQELYEGLRFLRTILQEQPNKFVEKIRQLTGDVICDAGVLILSLSHKRVEKDFEIRDLLRRIKAIILSLSQKRVEKDFEIRDLLTTIKAIRAEVEEKLPGTSKIDNHRTSELSFLDFLLEDLIGLVRSEADSNGKRRVKMIHEGLVFLRSFLGEIVDMRNQQEELQALWDRVVEVSHKVEHLIDPPLDGDIIGSFDSIIEDIRSIKYDVLKISNGEGRDTKVKDSTGTSDHVPSKSSALSTNEVFGFDNEARSIIERLKSRSKHLKIVAIVGMPGSGKTTLATKVFNDDSVTHYFHVRARCTVSHLFDKKKLLLELLSQTVTKLPDKCFTMNENDLVQELWRNLKKRRYLIFLDDVWDIEAWDALEASFPDDSYESRILLTSRCHDVAPVAKLDKEPLILRQLTDHESWELLQLKLFKEKGCPPAFFELGQRIAANCRGLPLTIVVIAGLLANIKLESWNEVLEMLISGSISITEKCKNTLELSYKHLPDYLKPCLLYFGVFPEDQEFSVRSMVWYWIAEGFVHKSESKSLEDVAKGYMMDLIRRSLVMGAQQRSIGGVKTCCIHDLLYDFCLAKAKEENFFHQLQGYDELSAFHAMRNIRRLCVDSQRKYFRKSRLFCPHLRSLFFFDQTLSNSGFDISFLVNIFKLLKVLNLEQTDLGEDFPSEIGLLVRLKYLAVTGHFDRIHPSIGNLSNLETFIVHPRGANVVLLPSTFWNLLKLRHVYVKSNWSYHTMGLSLPKENLDDNSILYQLDSFSGAVVFLDHMERQMRKFPNIRKLKFALSRYCDGTDIHYKILVPDFLCRLESLNLSCIDPIINSSKLEFGFPSNLKKLTLAGFGLPWTTISMIGKLPRLEVLKLLKGSFSGETWNMGDGEFSKLQFLKLDSLDIVRWTAFDDQFYLEKLVLAHCDRMEEIPSCSEGFATLGMIEVLDCPQCIGDSVKKIWELQREMGNTALKIVIRSSKYFNESSSESTEGSGESSKSEASA